jgi:hypothetical protein
MPLIKRASQRNGRIGDSEHSAAQRDVSAHHRDKVEADDRSDFAAPEQAVVVGSGCAGRTKTLVLLAVRTPWGVWVGAGEERVECHAEVEAFSFPAAAGIGRLPFVSCDHGRIAGGGRLPGADATTAGVVQLEPVGRAYGGPPAFV